jgi:hypothetical protein
MPPRSGTGEIRQGRGSIEIVDRAEIEAMACECYATLTRRSRGAFRIIVADDGTVS